MSKPVRLPFGAQTLSGAAIDVLWQLFVNGPTWDGDVSSKAGRNQLVELGLADRYEGFQWLTREGVISAVDAGYGDRKEAHQRKRRNPS